ncbi:MAG TPA: transposase, partial [Ignavibacteria bacterium]|nr:transposase [Ignavibacteria bacterium]
TRHGVSQQDGISQQEQSTNKFGKLNKNSVSVIINQFKSSVKRWCNKNGHENFKWQPRFHDHIIRNEGEHKRIKQYIIDNPSNWKEDKLSDK